MAPQHFTPLFHRFYRLWSLLLILCGSVALLSAQEESPQRITGSDPGDSIRIDRIILERNWITWDRIIMTELGFGEGDTVTFGQIDRAMSKIWNIGSFVTVDYTISVREGMNVMTIKAVDAVRFFPLIGIDHSSKEDYQYKLGIVDNNFLGSNTRLFLSWVKQPVGSSWDVHLRVPRQHLYKNMTLGFGFSTGHTIRRYLEREITRDPDGRVEAVEYQPLMLAPHDKLEVYTQIGNPWHLDYHYRFSPDLRIGYRKYDVNYELLDQEEMDPEVVVPPFNDRFLALQLSESIGIVNRKRHRKDGYVISAAYEASLDLRGGGKTYHTVSFGSEYHNSLTDIVQLSAWARTGYTTAEDPYKFISGSGSVLGLRLGELHGKAHYSAYLGAHFTWLNRSWLAVENAYFFNWGAGHDKYFRMFGERPFMAVGSSFVFQVPAASFLVVKFTFMYAGPGTEWFKFEM